MLTALKNHEIFPRSQVVKTVGLDPTIAGSIPAVETMVICVINYHSYAQFGIPFRSSHITYKLLQGFHIISDHPMGNPNISYFFI